MVASAIAGWALALGTGFAIVNPLHLAHGAELTAAGITGFFLCLTLIVAQAPSRAATRIGAAIGTGVLGSILVLSPLFLKAVATDSVRVVGSTKASTGHELVVQWNIWIDATPVILLRRGTGPFRQESLVYRGPMHGDLPTNVRFVGEDRIAFSTDRGTFSSGFDPWTLQVDPVHRW